MVAIPPSDAVEVLERWRQAAIDRSARDMLGVYASDALHEFPFTTPGAPSRIQGRGEIVRFVSAFWATGALTYERYRTTAIHQTRQSGTIVVEQEVEGTSSRTGPFALPNLVVLTVRNGAIVHLRDYVNVLAAAKAIGDDTPFL